MRNITGIPEYLDLGVLRYVSRYAFDVPVHSTNSDNFRSIVYLLLFRAVFYLHVNIYFTSFSRYLTIPRLDRTSKLPVCDNDFTSLDN